MTGILYDWGDFTTINSRFVCFDRKLHLLITFIPDEECHEFENETLSTVVGLCDGVSCKKGITYPIHEKFRETLEKHGCKIEEQKKQFTKKHAVLALKHHFPSFLSDSLASTTTVGLLTPSRLP